MKRNFLVYLSLLGFVSLNQFSHANPTNGYCQTVDGSVCGFNGGGGSSAPQYWYAGVAYDPDNGAFSIYTATSRELAMQSAAKDCKKANVDNPNALFSGKRRCSERISSAYGYTEDKDVATVITKGQLPNGKFQLNLRYGLHGQRTFFPSNSYSEKNTKVIAMEDCENKYKLANCEVVYSKFVF